MKRAAVLLAAALVLGYLGRAPHHASPASAALVRLLCGSERWSVKTFADGDRWKVDLTTRYRTIAQLNALVRPKPLPTNGRVPAELLVYRVTGTVKYAINEDDGDVHLGIEGADGSTLIADAPEPACTQKSRDRNGDQQGPARRAGHQSGRQGRRPRRRLLRLFHNQNGAAKEPA